MKTAIIIGATSGIGLEVARLLHQEGWNLGLMGRRADRLHAIAQEMGTNVRTGVIDVCSAEAPDALQALIQQLGGIDLLFHAAGIGFQNHDLEPDVELATAETNVLGFTRIITAAYRYFAQRQGGHIAVISSIAGTKGLGAAPAYSATKRYQNIYLQCLAQQAHMRHLSIHFTDIRPGFVDTALLAGGKYPMLMRPEAVARHIVRALKKRRRVVVIDWRYKILTFFWRLIPDVLWEKMHIKN